MTNIEYLETQIAVLSIHRDQIITRHGAKSDEAVEILNARLDGKQQELLLLLQAEYEPHNIETPPTRVLIKRPGEYPFTDEEISGSIE